MSARTTRRGFVAAAVAGAALPAVARGGAPAPAAAATTPRATARVVRRGRAIAVTPGAERLVVAHERRRTVEILAPGAERSHLVDVGGQPLDVAVAPGGAVAAVTTAWWASPGVAIVDLSTATVRERVDAGDAPSALAFVPGGRLVVAGGEQDGELRVLDEAWRVVARHPLGRVPRAVAPAEGGVWVSLNAAAQVVLVELDSGRIARRLSVPDLPDRIAVSPDGRRLLVTHGGRTNNEVSEVDVVSGAVVRHPAGRLPSAVAWTAGGRRLVALGGDAAVAVLGTGRRVAAAPAPRGLAVAGERAWTVSALTGEVREVAA